MDNSQNNPVIDLLNKNPTIRWGVAGFAVIAVATTAIAIWTGNLDTIIVFAQKYLVRKKPEITEAQRQKVREELIEILLKQVVERLEDSLYNKIRIDIKREEQRQRVGQGNLIPAQEEETEQITVNFIRRTFQRFLESTPPKAVSTSKSTQELYKQESIKGRLLILGEPGSGKTNELLALARDLLSQAQQSLDKPIPVIFQLSEWKAEQDFADWLAQQLFEKYSVPFVVSKHWMRHHQLLPLLDGLDELRRVDVHKFEGYEQTKMKSLIRGFRHQQFWIPSAVRKVFASFQIFFHKNRQIRAVASDEITPEVLDQQWIAKQIQCVREINAFLTRFALPLVVCCRRKEYEALEQQGEYLKQLNGAIYLQALEDDQIHDYLHKLKLPERKRDSLWEALQSQPELMKLAHSPLFLLILVVAYKGQNISSTEELLDEYIHKQLYDLNLRGAYPKGKAPTPKQTHHYLSWLASKLDFEGSAEFLIEKLQPSWLDTSKAYNQYCWMFRLIGGLIGGLIYGLIHKLSSGLSSGLIFGLSSGLIFGLFGGLTHITTSEKLSFSWGAFYRSGLGSVLIFGLFGGLSSGLSSGLFGGLSCGLIFGLISGITASQIDARDKTNANQGIKDSISNGLIVWLIFGLISGVVGGLFNELTGGLIVGLTGGLTGGLIFGLNAACKHLSLRIALYHSGVAPWNYARFLDHAENQRFIQRTGGRYRFVHDLLRKRFAATLKEN
ncbi:NACHT domain-containing protein [Acaryochloris marina]|uniref:NACHT domain-containing protein n=1 Tax=Acaryochloris marina TaxID=155978 RepID=UPI001EE67E53|nr:NACHT domain-containing protein [Acaryochloris marina]